MLHALMDRDKWSLCLGDEVLVQHSQDQPFVTMIRLEKRYSANRGSVKTTVEETDRVPLTEAEPLPGAEEAGARGGAVLFRGDGHSLRMEFRPCPGGVRCSFGGEPGWTYQFSFQAAAGEAVFGGGEQYRQLNLRGERVVNFVSEHIKASTILQKTVLPRSIYREKPHSHIGSFAPMPVFVTDRGRLFLFRTDRDGASQFGDRHYKFRFDGCPEEMVLLRDDSYEQLARLLVLGVDLEGLRFSETDLFFLASAACVTANAFLIKRAQTRRNVHTDMISYYNNLVVLVLFTVFTLARGDLGRLEEPGAGFWALAALGGLAQTGIYFFYYRNLRCSEVNLTDTGLVLLLALPGDLENGRLDSSRVRGFLLPAGVPVELHPLVLHFAPCRIRAEGFRCLVLLERGTNAPLAGGVRPDAAGEEALLWMRNKWMLCHPDSPQAAKGAYVGITGENLRLQI